MTGMLCALDEAIWRWHGLRPAEGDDDGQIEREIALGEVVREVLSFGVCAEADPKGAAAAALDCLSPFARVFAMARATGVIDDNMIPIESGLDDLEAAPAGMLDAPLLSPDPAATDELLYSARQMIASREAIHQAQHARLALRLGVEPTPDQMTKNERAQAPDLAALDARLRALLPSLWPIAPWRDAQRGRLSDAAWAARWWYSVATPIPDSDCENGEDHESDDAFARSIGGRVITRKERTIVLSRDQARRFLSTERGRKLADYLGAQLDLSAGDPTDAEIAEAIERSGAEHARAALDA